MQLCASEMLLRAAVTLAPRSDKSSTDWRDLGPSTVNLALCGLDLR
jgi:hypothetical protein